MRISAEHWTLSIIFRANSSPELRLEIFLTTENWPLKFQNTRKWSKYVPRMGPKMYPLASSGGMTISLSEKKNVSKYIHQRTKLADFPKGELFHSLLSVVVCFLVLHRHWRLCCHHASIRNWRFLTQLALEDFRRLPELLLSSFSHWEVLPCSKVSISKIQASHSIGGLWIMEEKQISRCC